jgi:hypothetical protein
MDMSNNTLADFDNITARLGGEHDDPTQPTRRWLPWPDDITPLLSPKRLQSDRLRTRRYCTVHARITFE